MKRILFILFSLFLSIGAYAQVDPNTGLNTRQKPRTGLFGGPKKVSSVNAANSLNKSFSFGSFTGVTDSTGILNINNPLNTKNSVFIPVNKDSSNYILTVTEIENNNIKVRVTDLIDGSLAPKDSTSVNIYWFIQRFVIVDDFEGV
jgi:hypothetical protein